MDRRRSPLTQVDLNLLVALDALLTERSVTRAAERLSLSQPAVSGTLARLRSLFEDELLVRDGRAMRPTPFAESLEAPLREALARVEETLTLRLEQGGIALKDVTPAIVVSVSPAFEESKAWYPTAALQTLVRVLDRKSVV